MAILNIILKVKQKITDKQKLPCWKIIWYFSPFFHYVSSYIFSFCKINLELEHRHYNVFGMHQCSIFQIKENSLNPLSHCCDAVFWNVAGKTTAGQMCVFPFMFNGITFTTCTNYGWHRQWCSLTDNYDRDGLWGECGG